jgi:hypothetical protein
MSTQGIADFTEAEREVIRDIVERRYGIPVPLELADSELRLNPTANQLTLCPTVFWSQRGCNFVIFKVGENRYRCQFYYSVREQYGTGIPEFTDLRQCATVLLQLQADHEAQRQGVIPQPDRNS